MPEPFKIEHQNSKITFYPAPARSFTEEQLAEFFARHDARDELFDVVRFLLHQRLAAATGDAADADAPDATVRHAAGRMAELTDFAAELTRRLENAALARAKPRVPRGGVK